MSHELHHTLPQRLAHSPAVASAKRVHERYRMVGAALASATGVIALGSLVGSVLPHSDMPAPVCTSLGSMSFKGDQYGGTVSGVAKGMVLDPLLEKGKAERKIIPNITDPAYNAALVDTTNILIRELKTDQLAADTHYKLGDANVCVEEGSTGALAVYKDTPQK